MPCSTVSLFVYISLALERNVPSFNNFNNFNSSQLQSEDSVFNNEASSS